MGASPLNCRLQLWLANANWVFNNSQLTTNSHAQARFLAKRKRCMDKEMDAKADIR
ncbi:hypothetical protein D3C78_1509700 [compost metagenome]|jgi:hypothetical protein